MQCNALRHWDIGAVHAGLRHHDILVHRSVPKETRVVVVGGSTGAHAIVTARATVHIDEHGFRTVEKTVFREEFHEVRADLRASCGQHAINSIRFGTRAFREKPRARTGRTLIPHGGTALHG